MNPEFINNVTEVILIKYNFRVNEGFDIVFYNVQLKRRLFYEYLEEREGWAINAVSRVRISLPGNSVIPAVKEA